ncbi:enkurin [Callorhinchus milii]|uniref:Enkurin, TRPC channel interacting protein n=2 Tax=Callorhinchus milii TaxID=7868 RepID=V9KVP5_CALMI|nr:enkurin [Callorhinchus milii]|eukprot:gi/632945172/ref/XP_007887906.1/ PREDICTED: enkurin [Callorhinchus milii]
MERPYPSECVYNLLPREVTRFKRPPRFISKHTETIEKEWESKKSSHKTMGLAKVERPCPKYFLQKHSKEPKPFEGKPFKCRENSGQVTITNEKPIMGLQSKKNFVHNNVMDILMKVPKKPVPIYVDTKRGNKNLLEPSGLVHKYLKKKDFGKTPQYITERKEEVKRVQEEYDAYVKEYMRKGAMKQLTEEERDAVLQGLKKNWEELHHEFQGLSVVIDSLPKKNNKLRLEASMKNLEKDIDLIERHKTIYIAHN